MDQPVDAVEVDERAEVDDVGDRALDDLAGLEAVEDPLAVLLALLLEHRARESTTLLRERLSSITLHSIAWPMYSSRFGTRRMSTSEAGRKPRTPRSMISPP